VPEVPAIVVDPQRAEPSGLASAGAARAKGRRTNATLIGATAGLAVVALIGVAGFMLIDRGDTAATSARDPAAKVVGKDANTSRQTADNRAADAPAKTTALEPSPAAQGPDEAARSAAGGQIAADGKTLWASPTAGAPLSLRYLPSSGQVFLALRPADILAHPEGAKLIDALGPAGQLSEQHLRTTLGVPLAQIEQLTIAFVPDDDGLPQAAYMMRLAGPIAPADLLQAWGQPRATSHKSKPYYRGPRLAYYLPADDEGRTVAIAPAALVEEVLERGGEPLLRNQIENLLGASDDARHVTLLVAPSYLLTDGQGLLVGDLAKLRDPMLRLFDIKLPAVLVSAHLGAELFCELRAAGPVDQRPDELAAALQARLADASQQIEQYVATLEPRPYGRLVINRFPRMVQLASHFTRAGAEGRQAVLRCYLPASAAHNLVLGAQLTLFEEPGLAAQSQPSRPAAPPTGAGGVAAALDKTISISFPRDTLEGFIDLLAKEIEVPIVILGRDLQLEGITKNQSFGLDERDKTAREILGKVLAMANPDGKLVYVIKPGDERRQTLFITTRAAAAARGESLPAELAGKTPAKKP
jgi:hypothetical protein